MKPIEYCLDRILDELKISWEDAARPPLKAEQLLTEFEAPAGRHEFFKSIILKLVNDGYAYFMHDPIPTMNDPLDWFTKRTMLTAEGLYLISEGGYQKRKINRDAENTRLDKIERGQRDFRRTQNVLLILVALGTLIAALYYCVDLYWHHGWFHF